MQSLSYICYKQVGATNYKNVTEIGVSVIAKTAPSEIGVLNELRIMPEVENDNYLPKMKTNKHDKKIS